MVELLSPSESSSTPKRTESGPPSMMTLLVPLVMKFASPWPMSSTRTTSSCALPGGGSAITVSVASPKTPLAAVARMIAVPTATPVARPAASTVATAGLDELHVQVVEVGRPSASTAEAVKVYVDPVVMVVDDGTTLTVTGGPGPLGSGRDDVLAMAASVDGTTTGPSSPAGLGVGGVDAELRRQHPVKWRRRSAALDVTQHSGARLDTGEALDLKALDVAHVQRGRVAGCVFLDEEAANALIGHCPHDCEIGNGTVRDPHFRAVQNPVLALLLCARLHVRRVGAAMRLDGKRILVTGGTSGLGRAMACVVEAHHDVRAEQTALDEQQVAHRL